MAVLDEIRGSGEAPVVLVIDRTELARKTADVLRDVELGAHVNVVNGNKLSRDYGKVVARILPPEPDGIAQ